MSLIWTVYCLTLFAVFTSKVASLPASNSYNSTCSASALPLPTDNTFCKQLRQSSNYCKNKGITNDSLLYERYPGWFQIKEEAMERMDNFILLAHNFQPHFTVDEECRRAVDIVYCRHYWPSCDKTGSVFKEQEICRETCDYLWRTCEREMAFVRELNTRSDIYPYWPYRWDIINCTTLPRRNAGSSPECWYYNGNSSEEVANDVCVYGDGSSYQGNISVTSSGIPCQSWTAQCPHRHTMVSTYPGLNNAKNFCRNPRGSGEKPWCFTTDGNQRWEYCNISECLPVDGGYSDWKLSSKCNAICGAAAVEVWSRSCDSPAPKYDGKNCSSLGKESELRKCAENLPPCPVHGGYGNWTANSKCNATCGEGYMKWTRKCDNPTPKYNGRNCSLLGPAMKWELCKGLEICEIFGKEGFLQRNANKIIIGAAIAVAFLFFVVFTIFVYRKWKKMKMKEYAPYATFDFSGFGINSVSPGVSERDNDVTPSCDYGNLTEDGEPIPGVTRGIIPYQPPYVNTSPINDHRYAKLPLFSSITLDWLRNTWGQVDTLGKHVYDVLHRGLKLPSLYDRRENVIDKHQVIKGTRDNLGAVDDNGEPVYDLCERPGIELVHVVICQSLGDSNGHSSNEGIGSDITTSRTHLLSNLNC